MHLMHNQNKTSREAKWKDYKFRHISYATNLIRQKPIFIFVLICTAADVKKSKHVTIGRTSSTVPRQQAHGGNSMRMLSY